MKLRLFTILLNFFIPFVFGFDANSNSNIAVYWGQNSGGTQGRLADYCASSAVDIVVLSFLYVFPSPLALNFANACEGTYTPEGLLHCSTIGEDIKTCQSLGKKVLLSLGGASGAYGFNNDGTATAFATTLWQLFGNGASTAGRPFDDAVVDGFDFDIENQSQTGYVALVAALRNLFSTDSSKQYYISASPQCVYPDASVGNILANSDIDFAFVQFYNNWCNLGPNFNWNVWEDFAQNVSPNKNIKIFVGLPGNALSAGSGYLPASSVSQYLTSDILENPNFGGISLWDASSAWDNYENSLNFIQNMKNLVSQNAVVTTTSSTISALPTTGDYTRLSTLSDITSTTITNSIIQTASSSPSTTSTTSTSSTSTTSTSTTSTSTTSTSTTSTSTTSSSTTSSSTTSSSVTSASATSIAASSSSAVSILVSPSSSVVAPAVSSSAKVSSSANPQLTAIPTTKESVSSPVVSTSEAATVKTSEPTILSTILPTSIPTSIPTSVPTSVQTSVPTTPLVTPVETSLPTSTQEVDPTNITTQLPTTAPTPTAYTYNVLTVIDGVTVIRTFTTTGFTTQYVTIYNKQK